MSTAGATRSKGIGSFRTRLFSAIMVIVATLTALGFYLAQRRVTADAERNLQQTFQTELSSMHKVEELRYVALVDRCNTLVAKPRIHAAIEDYAIDLLYPTAKDELRDLISVGTSTDQLRAACRKQGMTTLREAGLRAIFNGVTTIDEVVHETVLEDEV